MSSDEDYDLKKTKVIGQLYPVLLDAKGQVIDGKHRLEADSNWRCITLPQVDTEEKRIIYSIIANLQRRKVPPEEKGELINAVAEIYKKQGYKVLISSNEIVQKIVEVTGLSQPTVNKYLDDKFKVYTSTERKRKAKISAADRIRNKLGEEVLERHEQEVKKKLSGRSSEEVLSAREVLKKKRERIISKLPDEKDRKALTEEAEQYDLTPEQVEERVVEILDSKAGFEPALMEMFVTKEQLALDRIVEPLKRFARVDISILNDLDSEQKEKVLTVLLDSRRKIDEMVKAIEEKK